MLTILGLRETLSQRLRFGVVPRGLMAVEGVRAEDSRLLIGIVAGGVIWIGGLLGGFSWNTISEF